MTDDRSLERAARSFIESGPTRAPERAVEAALIRIETTSQERGLRVPWRITMTTPARVAAAAVIGVLAIGGALFLIGRAGQPNVGGPVRRHPLANVERAGVDRRSDAAIGRPAVRAPGRPAGGGHLRRRHRSPRDPFSSA